MNLKEIITTIPITDVKRALHFYTNTLNFEPQTLSEDLGMYWIIKEQHKFLLYLREAETKAEHTVMSFTVEDVEKELTALEQKGVEFYTDKGHKIFNLDGSLSAWFKDSEENTLEISQRQ